MPMRNGEERGPEDIDPHCLAIQSSGGGSYTQVSDFANIDTPFPIDITSFVGGRVRKEAKEE